MTITCATHFTPSSAAAMQVATGLAKRRHERLHLINVLDGDARGTNGPQLENAARAALDRDAQLLARRGVEALGSVVRGRLGSAVGQFVKQTHSELLVAGDTNHLTDALHESTLEQLADSVEVPLFVVRNEGPILDWLEGRGPLRVMLGLDRTRSAGLALSWVEQLAGFGPLDLLASHIWWPPHEYTRRHIVAPSSDDAHLCLEDEIRLEDETLLEHLPHNVCARVCLRVGLEDVAEQLISLAVDHEADLFVLGRQPSRGLLARLWTVSHDVLGLAPMSVVCVPEVRRPTSGALAQQVQSAPAL
jgi:nucleotide-binding universal stress UspA family protein